MTSKAYVYIDGIDASPIICGVIELDEKYDLGKFRYGKTYLQRKDAFALDPINLPLSGRQYVTTVNKGLFGALSDAGPDSWGKRVILSLHKTKPKNALEYLLAGSNMGAGALVFSLSSSASKSKRSRNNLGELSVLLKAKDALLNDEAIPLEARKALQFGSSMGGARPKTIIQDGYSTYLAKFNRPDDLFNVVKVEHAAMSMLSELPCRVSTTSVKNTPIGDVFLAERFDMTKGLPHCHFLSANSIFNTAKVSNESLKLNYSYGYLAEFIMKYGADPLDAHELFYRMVFNVFIGNTDDHARNHACIYDFETREWRLSPAFDVLPINNSGLHGIGLGEQGRFGNIDNLLSQSVRFGLKQAKAKRIIEDVRALVGSWQRCFSELGVGDADIERLKGVVPKVE